MKKNDTKKDIDTIKYKPWHELALVLFDNGMKKKDIFAWLELQGYDVSYNTIKNYLTRHGRTGKPPQHCPPVVMSEQNSFDMENPSDEVMQSLGEENVRPTKSQERRIAIQNQEPETVENEWDDGTRVILFGLIGDTQMGSKYTQITHLNKFYDICVQLGIKDVYHTGDISDGIKMRPGHEYELYKISADEMKDDIVKNYPRREGITTRFITGNHDASIYKHVGYDIGKAIALERDDMEYLGRDCAIVKLTPNCTMELRHPWDGTAYAQSYKIQKMIEAMESDSKPNILAVGHYHKTEYLFYRNIHAFQTGCFQSQTPFTRGKGISVALGGWIVGIEVNKEGTILSLTQKFVPFYSAIKDDYKNYIGE